MYLGLICGDQCTYKTCQCGENSFKGSKTGQYYCCNENSECKQEQEFNWNGFVACPKGDMISINKKCNQKCPKSNHTSNYIAISSTKCDSEKKCFDNGNVHYSKICLKDLTEINEDFVKYCSAGVDCGKPKNSQLSFQQCYTGYTHYFRYGEGILCIARVYWKYIQCLV